MKTILNSIKLSLLLTVAAVTLSTGSAVAQNPNRADDNRARLEALIDKCDEVIAAYEKTEDALVEERNRLGAKKDRLRRTNDIEGMAEVEEQIVRVCDRGYAVRDKINELKREQSRYQDMLRNLR